MNREVCGKKWSLSIEGNPHHLREGLRKMARNLSQGTQKSIVRVSSRATSGYYFTIKPKKIRWSKLVLHLWKERNSYKILKGKPYELKRLGKSTRR
jgi:hypothetical protein